MTGATGFVGRYLIDELERRGDELAAVVRPSREAADLERRGVALVREDLRRPSGGVRERLEQTDVVYHLAAGVSGGWRGTFDLNVAATESLVGAMNESGWRGRLVHVSSFSVYGFNQLAPGSTVDETTPLEPNPGRRDDYAWSKLWQERVVSRLEGAELVTVRPGAIYGRERGFQYRIGRTVGDGMVLLMGGGNVMPLTYVENTASLIAEAGRHERAAGEVFNVVDPEPVTQREYLRRWRRAHPGKVTVVPVPLALIRLVGAALDRARERTGGRMGPPALFDPYVMEPSFRRFTYATGKAAEVLDWAPPVSLDEALRRTFGT